MSFCGAGRVSDLVSFRSPCMDPGLSNTLIKRHLAHIIHRWALVVPSNVYCITFQAKNFVFQ